MSKAEPAVFTFPTMRNLSKEVRKSVTHSEFWIPEDERELYKKALLALNEAGVPYVVAGAYAIYEHTGIIRQTKDLDLFCTPEAVLQAMQVLRDAGMITRLEQPHWIGKAISRDNRDHFIDIIYGMGNGLALIDDDWFRHSSPAILAATQVRVAPPEELIWHRLFINERHRHDMADIAHLILCVGHLMDWRRLLNKTGENWPLLLSQVLMFRYVYPGYRDQVPQWVMQELLERAQAAGSEGPAEGAEHDMTRGTMISRFSFAIDVNEWGFHDLRNERIEAMCRHPVIARLQASDVWDEVADHAAESQAPETADAEE
jgi:hypothetical protein